MNRERAVLECLLLSAVASSLLISFAIMGLPPGGALGTPGRVAIGAVFIAVCVLGILSATGIIHLGGNRQGPVGNEEGEEGQRRRVGHHPDCERFASHTIILRNKVHCCGCLGLTIGSGLAIFVMVMFTAVPMILAGHGLTLVIVGLVATAFAFAETAVHASPPIHLLANILLPVAFSMVTIGVSEASGNVPLGLVTVLICILLMETRISISEWKHAEICLSCGRECRSY